MSQFHPDEHPLADSPTTTAFPDDSLYGSSDDPVDTTYDSYETALQPQILAARVGEAQTDLHASWASAFPAPEVNPPLDSGPKGNLTSSSAVVRRMFPRPTRGRDRELGPFSSFGNLGKLLPKPI